MTASDNSASPGELRVPDLPILVDIDTGWGSAFNIARTEKQMIAPRAAEQALFQ